MVDASSWKPCVLWFTGLSGAGKSTIADAVAEKLKKAGVRVERLDGDIVREFLPNTGFDPESRKEHIRRVGFIAHMLERNDITVVCSFISPYRESREYVRQLCNDFREIYVATPIDVCEQRDPKGLYQKVRAGEIDQFTGIDAPFEAPESPELILETSSFSIDDSAQLVLEFKAV